MTNPGFFELPSISIRDTLQIYNVNDPIDVSV